MKQNTALPKSNQEKRKRTDAEIAEHPYTSDWHDWILSLPKEVKPIDRAVLLALSNYVNRAHKRAGKFVVWPSHATIAGLIGSSVRPVQDSLDRLVDLGIVGKIGRDGTSNQYLLPPPIIGTHAKSAYPSEGGSVNSTYPLGGINVPPSVNSTDELSKEELSKGKGVNLTSEPSATQGNTSNFPQENVEEKGAVATPADPLQPIALAEAIAAKFLSAGTNYEARYGLYCELTKAFHPQIVPLIGTQYFKKLITPLDKYAKKLAVAGQADHVSQSIAQMFAVCDDDFPDPDLNASDAENLMASVQQFVQLKLQEPVG